jgi:hypothetical protein
VDKSFIIEANSTQEMKDWIAAVDKASDYSSVSAPYNVQHEIHVDFDSATGFSVSGERGIDSERSLKAP